MMSGTLWMLAMAGPKQGQGGADSLGMFIPMIIIFVIFYFMLIRPQRRKDKQRKEMIDNIKSGERILFSGGILGTVTNVKDQILVVKIADNVKIEVSRGAVVRVLEKGQKVEEEPEKK